MTENIQIEAAEGAFHTFLKRWLGDWGGWLLALFTLIVAGYTAFFIFPFASEEQRPLISNCTTIAIYAGPTILALRTLLHPLLSKRARVGWSLIMLANLSFSLGTIVWLYYENIAGEQPFPSWADAGYLAFYPLMLAGLLCLVERMRSAEERLNFTLDASVIVIGGGLILWYFLLGPIASTADDDTLKTALSLAYPIGDLVLLLGISALLLRRAEFGRRAPVNLLLVGLIINFIYDFIFSYQNLSGTYVSGSATDCLFSAPSIPLMLAAHVYYIQASDDPAAERPYAPAAPRFFWMPYIAVVAVFFVMFRVAAEGDAEQMTKVLLAAAVVAALVIFRQFMFVRENTKAGIALTEMQERIQGIYSASTDAIGLAEFSGTITEVNDSFVRLTGYRRDQIVGAMNYMTFLPDDYIDRSLQPGIELRERRPIEYERELVRKDGTTRNVTTTLFAVNGGDGSPAAIAIVIRDITDRRQLESQLTYQALHDPLTGLANRALLGDRVTAALSRARRLRSRIAVLFLDLDNFKTVNDTLGHAAGDSLLTTVADRLRSCLRSSDTAARLGGDEFAVLIEDIINPGEELAVADRILTAIRTPVEVGGKEALVGASIGIALSSSSVVTSADILRNADVAMYAAKKEGKNCYSVYEDSMHAAVMHRAQLESEIRASIDHGDFEIFYQPIIDLADGGVSAVEALLRWNHPRGIDIGPAEFIPIAEEANLIVPLGRWVLEESCRRAAELHRTVSGSRPFSLTVNVSGRQFADPGFTDIVEAALGQSGLPPDKLILEITESTMLVNTDATVKKLGEVRALGVRLAVDDFGTGYSSLSYLNRFPIDVLKIDRSFVEKINDGEHGAAMARAVISMSETLRLTTIAEGIETLQQLDRLKDLGCAWGQGYHFARPLSARNLEAYITEASSPQPQSIRDAFAKLSEAVRLAPVQ